MIDTAIPGAGSSAATSISAPLRAAGDAVATSLGSFVDTATKRGRKTRNEAGKRARAEIAHQRRTIGKSAKKAKKQSRKAWADFAEETSTRASNIAEASKGARVTPHGNIRRVTAVLAVALAVAVAVAVLVMRKKQPALPATTDNPTSEPAPTTPPH